MRKKRSRRLGNLLTVIIVLFILNLCFSTGVGNFPEISRNPMKSGASVVQLNINGVISAETQRDLLSQLRGLSENSGIRGVLLNINSPGGTTGTSQEIFNELMKLRKSGVKIVSVIEDLGASGGYYAASASDWIVANGSSLTGSIGVILSTMNFKGIADKYGIKSINFTSGKMKDMLSPFRDVRPDEREYIQQMITTIYGQFVQDVLTGRNGSEKKLTREKLLSVADGRVFTGIDAKKEGLIDEIGGYSVALDAMKKLLGVDQLSVKSFSKGYMQQVLQLLKGEYSGSEVISRISPLGAMSQEFLKQHLNTPLYYMAFGSDL